MQTRGPGQSSNETESGGQAHPASLQTGSGVMSLSQLGEQHRSVAGTGAPLQVPPVGPRQNLSAGQSADEANPPGQAHPEAVQSGPNDWEPMQLPSQHRKVAGVSQGPLLQLGPAAARATAVATHESRRIDHTMCIAPPPDWPEETVLRSSSPPARG
jgi:hypothetical protein